MFSVNPIVTENLLPGTPQSVWDVTQNGGNGDPTLQGFAAEFSIDQGQTVHFKITNSALAPYRIEVYRLGYYGGNGARLVTTIPAAQTLRTAQPTPLYDAATGLIDAGNWSVSASWQAPATAVSGIYFAKLVREDTGGASQIVFVVRDDDGRSDLLFQTSDTTWQAYNDWGGNSLYFGTAPAGRAYAVSYNRPFNTRAGTPHGRDFVFGPEFAMARFLEANGYSVSYASGIDTDRAGAELLEHRAFLSVGHDEYWSGAQRTNVEAARDAGVSLMFFSGNQVYWKTRWEPSIDGSGTPYRTLVCYKETIAAAPIDPSPEWTGTWRDPRYRPESDRNHLAENALSGLIWEVNRGPGGETGTPFTVPAAYAGLRFWRNTTVAALQPGQTATLGDIVLGYEWDVDRDNGFRPAGLIRMSSTTQVVPEQLDDGYVNCPFGGGGPNPSGQCASCGCFVRVGTSTHTLTMYRAESGALVFGAGTVQWSYGLDGVHDGPPTTPDPAMRQATVNILADAGVQPFTLAAGLIPALMSDDVARPTSALSAPGAAPLTAGQPITITGTATDVGGVVGGIEVSTDGGLTWRRADGTTTWTYTWTPPHPGQYLLRTRATDDSGNIELPGAGTTIQIGSAPTSTVGLVAAYGFNEGTGTVLGDSSGRGNNGTISGPTWAAGLSGGALSFNGAGDWVTVPDSASLDLTNGMTIEAWVRPSSAQSGTVIMKEKSTGLVYGLFSTDGTGRPPSGYVSPSDATAPAVVAASPLPLGVWSHIAVTYDGTMMRLYVNGNAAGMAEAGGAIQTSNGALRIGGSSIWGEYFQGLIDDVRIYNRVLTSGEIVSDLGTPVGGALDATPPTGAISSPAAGAAVGGIVPLSATASDGQSGIAGVQFLVNGVPVGSEQTRAPFSVSWNSLAVPNGVYTIAARIRDGAGNVTTTAGITVVVTNPPDTVPPTVSLSVPASGLRVSGTTVLTAQAADGRRVAGVTFKINGATIGTEVTSAPYRVAWDTTGLANGTYVLTAVARDMAGNITTSAAISVVVDNSPLTATLTPAPGASGVPTDTIISLAFNEDTIPSGLTIVLRDASNNVVSGALAFNPATSVATFVPTGRLQPGMTYTVTAGGARDAAGNVMPSTTWTFTTDPTANGLTIWPATAVPAVVTAADATPVELGVKFQSSAAGSVTGVRFYKGAGNTGTHVGRLWTATGTLLATVTFADESASGWQEATFSSPVAIAANTTYVVSYYAPAGGYSQTPEYFATSGVLSAPLSVPSSSAAGGNGVYRYGAGGGFPDQSFGATNYWVDVVFTAGGAADTVPPAVTARTPGPGATGVSTGAGVSVTFSEPVQPGTVGLQVLDGGAPVPGAVTYDAGARTATFQPAQGWQGLRTYTVRVTGVQDLAGNLMPTDTWTFTTGPTATGSTIWPATAVPAVVTAADATPVELGVKFQSSAAGSVTGVRFYKGAGNTGTHVGRLWTATGTLLATVTFADESASGWQEATFSSPVAIAANTTYVVSYYAPAGGYSYTNGYFQSSGFSNGTLQVLSSGAGGGGVYLYGTGGGFPSQSYQATNYWVDVVFTAGGAADTVPPAVTARTPGPGATGVSTGAGVSVTFSEPVQPGTVGLQVLDGGAPVPGAVTYDAGARTATFQPAQGWQGLRTYTVRVTGVQDLAGNLMPTDTWTFTTDGRWQQTAVADFVSGVTTGTFVSNAGGGAVQLSPTFRDDFTGPQLGSAWAANSWGNSAAPVTVVGGTAVVAGGAMQSAVIATGVEGSVLFGAAPYQNFGLATDLSTGAGNSWATFGTGASTNSLYARVNVNGTTSEVLIGPLPTTFHVYRVRPVASGFEFAIDGVVVATIALVPPAGTAMRLVASDYSGAAPLTVDWAGGASYPASGVFTSVTYDAGQTVDLGSVTWTATQPAGTSVRVEVQVSGDNTVWSAWTQVGNGAPLSGLQGRYLRYQVTLMSTDPVLTPELSDIALSFA